MKYSKYLFQSLILLVLMFILGTLITSSIEVLSIVFKIDGFYEKKDICYYFKTNFKPTFIPLFLYNK